MYNIYSILNIIVETLKAFNLHLQNFERLIIYLIAFD